jgi:hypothetical protein
LFSKRCTSNLIQNVAFAVCREREAEGLIPWQSCLQ